MLMLMLQQHQVAQQQQLAQQQQQRLMGLGFAGDAGSVGGINFSGGNVIRGGLHYLPGALVDLPSSDGKKKRKGKYKRKKVKGKPKRPLSAYNLFFRDHRAQIIEEFAKEYKEKGKESKDDADAESDSEQKKTEGSGLNFTSEGTVPQDLKGDGDKFKGGVGFENLAKMIGAAWKAAVPVEVEKYKKLAEADLKRYKNEMETWLARQQDVVSLDAGKAANPLPAPIRSKETTDEPGQKKYKISEAAE